MYTVCPLQFNKKNKQKYNPMEPKQNNFIWWRWQCAYKMKGFFFFHLKN